MLFSLTLLLAGALGAPLFPYLDPTLPTAQRAANLISLLNITEKTWLLNADTPALPHISLPPYSFARECERGDSSGRTGTLFPSGAAIAASWDVDLAFQIARFTALEAKSNANVAGLGASSSCFGPVVNYIHDSKWGRTNEMLTGEDTTLGSQLGAAFVRGLQSWSVATPQGLRYAVTSTVKHLLSYSGPEGYGFTFGPHATRFSFEAAFSSQHAWREFFLPAFRAAAKAGAKGFMCSYSSFSTPDGYLNNTPACASPQVLNDTLRGGWGWEEGFVISDAGAVAFTGSVDIGGIPFGHASSATQADSAIASLTAGCDNELTCCGAPRVFPTLEASVQAGRVAEAALDASLARLIRNRVELGNLDPPGTYPWSAWGAGNVSTPEMVEATAAAAAQGCVLLKNEGGLLPLAPADYAGKTFALIGPIANDSYAVR
jgi:beta-glucosidase